jgi:hypothetical protein
MKNINKSRKLSSKWTGIPKLRDFIMTAGPYRCFFASELFAKFELLVMNKKIQIKGAPILATPFIQKC